jgi:hypothetical protein
VRVRGAGDDLDGASHSVEAGDIHRLNNALAGITSYVSLILEERRQDKDLQEKLGLVLEAAKKAATVLPGWE